MKRKFQEFFKKKGVLQKDIAKEIGVRQDMVGRFIVRPNYKFIKDISNLFPDIDLNYILKEEKEEMLFSNEPPEGYANENNEELLDKIEISIQKLRENLSQK